MTSDIQLCMLAIKSLNSKEVKFIKSQLIKNAIANNGPITNKQKNAFIEEFNKGFIKSFIISRRNIN